VIHVHAYRVLTNMQVRVTCAQPVEEPKGLQLLYSCTATVPAPDSPEGSSDELFTLAQALFDAATDLHATEHSG